MSAVRRIEQGKVKLTGWNRNTYFLFFGLAASVQGVSLIGVGVSTFFMAVGVYEGLMPNFLAGFALMLLFVMSFRTFRPLPADAFAPLPILTPSQEQILREFGGLRGIAKMNAQEKEAAFARVRQG